MVEPHRRQFTCIKCTCIFHIKVGKIATKTIKSQIILISNRGEGRGVREKVKAVTIPMEFNRQHGQRIATLVRSNTLTFIRKSIIV